jgi:hypothetical protein
VRSLISDLVISDLRKVFNEPTCITTMKQPLRPHACAFCLLLNKVQNIEASDTTKVKKNCQSCHPKPKTQNLKLLLCSRTISKLQSGVWSVTGVSPLLILRA